MLRRAVPVATILVVVVACLVLTIVVEGSASQSGLSPEKLLEAQQKRFKWCMTGVGENPGQKTWGQDRINACKAITKKWTGSAYNPPITNQVIDWADPPEFKGKDAKDGFGLHIKGNGEVKEIMTKEKHHETDAKLRFCMGNKDSPAPDYFCGQRKVDWCIKNYIETAGLTYMPIPNADKLPCEINPLAIDPATLPKLKPSAEELAFAESLKREMSYREHYEARRVKDGVSEKVRQAQEWRFLWCMRHPSSPYYGLPGAERATKCVEHVEKEVAKPYTPPENPSFFGSKTDLDSLQNLRVWSPSLQTSGDTRFLQCMNGKVNGSPCKPNTCREHVNTFIRGRTGDALRAEGIEPYYPSVDAITAVRQSCSKCLFKTCGHSKDWECVDENTAVKFGPGTCDEATGRCVRTGVDEQLCNAEKNKVMKCIPMMGCVDKNGENNGDMVPLDQGNGEITYVPRHYWSAVTAQLATQFEAMFRSHFQTIRSKLEVFEANADYIKRCQTSWGVAGLVEGLLTECKQPFGSTSNANTFERMIMPTIEVFQWMHNVDITKVRAAVAQAEKGLALALTHIRRAHGPKNLADGMNTAINAVRDGLNQAYVQTGAYENKHDASNTNLITSIKIARVIATTIATAGYGAAAGTAEVSLGVKALLSMRTAGAVALTDMVVDRGVNDLLIVNDDYSYEGMKKAFNTKELKKDLANAGINVLFAGVGTVTIEMIKKPMDVMFQSSAIKTIVEGITKKEGAAAVQALRREVATAVVGAIHAGALGYVSVYGEKDPVKREAAMTNWLLQISLGFLSGKVAGRMVNGKVSGSVQAGVDIGAYTVASSAPSIINTAISQPIHFDNTRLPDGTEVSVNHLGSNDKTRNEEKEEERKFTDARVDDVHEKKDDDGETKDEATPNSDISDEDESSSPPTYTVHYTGSMGVVVFIDDPSKPKDKVVKKGFVSNKAIVTATTNPPKTMKRNGFATEVYVEVANPKQKGGDPVWLPLKFLVEKK